MVTVSDSALPRVEKCPASAVLPHVGHMSPAADMGSAIHQHLEERVTLGYVAAMARLEDVANAWALQEPQRTFYLSRCRKFLFRPPAGAIVEKALAWRPDVMALEGFELSAVEVSGARGRYDMPTHCVSPGTFDVAWSEPAPIEQTADGPRCPPGSTLYVVDYKSGLDTWVDPVETNLQVHNCAAKAAVWLHAERYVPTIVYVQGEDGIWDSMGSALDAGHIEHTWRRVIALLMHVHKQELTLSEGRPLDLVEGHHCTYCPAFTRCPAKTALLKGLLDAHAPFGDAPLTPEQAARLAAMLPKLQALGEQTKAYLQAYVLEHGPIELGPNLVWGPYQKSKDHILPHLALPILLEELGENAYGCIKLTKTAISEAVKAHLDEHGVQRKAAATMRHILGRFGVAGALLSTTETWWTAHRPGAKSDEEV